MRRDRWRTVGAALVALAAWAGAPGLVFGFNAPPATLEHRLPLHSPVLGGLALVVVVALPYSVLAVWARRHDPRWHAFSVVCGFVLTGWIFVELAFIRELSFLHPVCAAVGAAFIWFGLRAPSEEPTR